MRLTELKGRVDSINQKVKEESKQEEDRLQTDLDLLANEIKKMKEITKQLRDYEWKEEREKIGQMLQSRLDSVQNSQDT